MIRKFGHEFGNPQSGSAAFNDNRSWVVPSGLCRCSTSIDYRHEDARSGWIPLSTRKPRNPDAGGRHVAYLSRDKSGGNVGESALRAVRDRSGAIVYHHCAVTVIRPIEQRLSAFRDESEVNFVTWPASLDRLHNAGSFCLISCLWQPAGFKVAFQRHQSRGIVGSAPSLRPRVAHGKVIAQGERRCKLERLEFCDRLYVAP